MLNFENISINHKQKYESCISDNNKLNSISDFNFFYLWNTKNNIKISFWNDFAIVKGIWNGKTYYYSPSIKDINDFNLIFGQILDLQKDTSFIFAGLNKEIANQITTQDNLTIKFDRNACDYIYLTDDLMNLRGKKFHAKKNFVNSFIKNYKYDFVEYNDSYYEQILNLYDNWSTQSEHSVDSNEKIAIETALKNYKQLGLNIGILLIDNEIGAFSVSAISVYNIAQVFFEKANTNYKGIYAMINYLTANTYLSNTEYINREEDMGIEGLRKAKLSYNPAIIYEKYLLEYKYE